MNEQEKQIHSMVQRLANIGKEYDKDKDQKRVEHVKKMKKREAKEGEKREAKQKELRKDRYKKQSRSNRKKDQSLGE